MVQSGTLQRGRGDATQREAMLPELLHLLELQCTTSCEQQLVQNKLAGVLVLSCGADPGSRQYPVIAECAAHAGLPSAQELVANARKKVVHANEQPRGDDGPEREGPGADDLLQLFKQRLL
eukprot:scaffold6348_cov259-Pinguiococcus_pyrenoidosus.AAC.10